MSQPANDRPPPTPAAKPAPGRPKDLAKRAAILDAATRMFTQLGFEGASMDQIASLAGVSKLTVYSHFGDKDALFVAVVQAYCQQQLPTALFEPSPETPLRERLLDIARAFHAMIMAPEAVAGHRMLCTPQWVDSALPQMFWDAGPKRLQGEFAALLQRRAAAGELDLADPARAASQFFALLKGDAHAQLVIGCCDPGREPDVEGHLVATVDMFLRAYAATDQQA